MSEKPPHAWRPTMKRRLAVAAAVAAVWSFAILTQLVSLQVFQHEALSSKARGQQSSRVRTPAKRGHILDRDGGVLASSVTAYTIKGVPAEIEKPSSAARAICAVLDDCDAGRQADIERRLSNTSKDSVHLVRQVSPPSASRIAGLGLAGIEFEEEDRRYYPNRNLAAHVVGYVGVDHTGLGGIEATYDDLIKGQEGSMIVQTSASGARVNSRVEVAPTTGATLELTISEPLQHILERELRAGVREHQAAAGTALILDPWTGEILALASYPSFNPNAFAGASASALRNRAVQDTFEPGSTFKIVTASAALEQDVVETGDLIDVSGGKISFGSDVIRDIRDYKVLTFGDAIVKSSNVGAIKVALELGADRLTEYIRRFGFGRRASPHDFRGEADGIVWDPAKLDDRALARVSIGYHVSVTALQMAAAASAIANGGELIEPRVLRAVIRDGVREPQPRTVVHRAVTPEIAAELTAIMEDVVDRGTGTYAQVPGFTVAGKTGTARKWLDGGYLEEYNASFVGFVPSRNPVFTILVVIDSPRRPNVYHGGPVAGPVFRRIAEAALQYAGVPRTVDQPPPLLVRRQTGGQSPYPVIGPVRPRALVAAVAPTGVRGDVVPDLSGLSAREALPAVSALRLRARLIGDGLVVAQRPAAGRPLGETTQVTLWLDRRAAVQPAADVEP